MDNLTVVRVESFSPGDESAWVTLSSGQAEITLFCHPCSLSTGQRIRNELPAQGTLRAAYLQDWPEDLKLERSTPRLERWEAQGLRAWRGCGRVVDAQQGIVDVLGLRLHFGEILPVADGAALEFECEYLDL